MGGAGKRRIYRGALLGLVLVATPVGARPASAQETSVEGTFDDRDEFGKASASAEVGLGWKGALQDSVRLLLLEHAARVVVQPKTRRELGGPFFSDYRRSLHVPRSWSDGDGWVVNYVGHPIHGAAAGYIWLDHEPESTGPGLSRGYFASRTRAAAWSAIFSLQFELGPLSEASIGNVGLRPNTTGWVDHVITPTGAFGLIVAEDVLDRFVVRKLEARTSSRVVQAVARVAMNPSRSLANLARGRAPWFRPDRPLAR